MSLGCPLPDLVKKSHNIEFSSLRVFIVSIIIFFMVTPGFHNVRNELISLILIIFILSNSVKTKMCYIIIIQEQESKNLNTKCKILICHHVIVVYFFLNNNISICHSYSIE